MIHQINLLGKDLMMEINEDIRDEGEESSVLVELTPPSSKDSKKVCSKPDFEWTFLFKNTPVVCSDFRRILGL